MCEGMSEKDLADGYRVAAALCNGEDVYDDCLKYIAEIRRLQTENATLRAVWPFVQTCERCLPSRANQKQCPLCKIAGSVFRPTSHTSDCPIAAAEKLMGSDA